MLAAGSEEASGDDAILRPRYLNAILPGSLLSIFRIFSFFRSGRMALIWSRVRADRRFKPDQFLTRFGCRALLDAEQGAASILKEDHRDANHLYATNAGVRPRRIGCTGCDPDGRHAAETAARAGFSGRVTRPGELRQDAGQAG